MTFKKILVALERKSEQSPAIFALGLGLAEKGPAQILVFHCLPRHTVAEIEDRVGTLAELEGSQTLAKQDQWLKGASEHIDAWLEGFCRQARDKGLEATSMVDVGRPGNSIVRTAGKWGADLIVMGRPLRGALSGLIRGGVGGWVLHHATCSVLFVHEAL
ncbi:MAG: universal stress protein [Thermodesulfobacteriota bacterium]